MQLILIEIYDVAGREDESPISSQDIINKVKEIDKTATVEYASDLNTAEHMIREHAENFDVILIIGAGDADELAKKLADTKVSSSV